MSANKVAGRIVLTLMRVAVILILAWLLSGVIVFFTASNVQGGEGYHHVDIRDGEQKLILPYTKIIMNKRSNAVIYLPRGEFRRAEIERIR